jgi:hypothetical protein
MCGVAVCMVCLECWGADWVWPWPVSFSAIAGGTYQRKGAAPATVANTHSSAFVAWVEAKENVKFSIRYRPYIFLRLAAKDSSKVAESCSQPRIPAKHFFYRPVTRARRARKTV